MRRAVVCGLALVLLLGCSSGTQTGSHERLVAPANTRTIEGTVTLDGRAVAVPLVSSSLGTTVFGDQAGHYTMQVPLFATGIRLSASNGYAPGQVYAVISSGSAAVPNGGSHVTVNIALTFSTPI